MAVWGRVVAQALHTPRAAAAIAVTGQRYLGTGGVHPPVRETDEEVLDHLKGVFDLKDKIVMVTGAAGGVGRAAALGFATAGASLVLADLPDKADELSKLASKLQSLHGCSAVPVILDVRDRESVDAAFKDVGRVHGKLDVLVANAGILGMLQQPQEVDEENWKNVFATNVDGVFHSVRAAYPLLKRSSHRGKIVITSSIAGFTGYATQSPYCASKGALIPFAKSLALAWAPDRINVNLVLPGAVNTPFAAKVVHNEEKLGYMLERIPLGRLAEPEDIVGPIMFLASRASDYCTGSTLVVDGGGTSRAMAH